MGFDLMKRGQTGQGPPSGAPPPPAMYVKKTQIGTGLHGRAIAKRPTDPPSAQSGDEDACASSPTLAPPHKSEAKLPRASSAHTHNPVHKSTDAPRTRVLVTPLLNTHTHSTHSIPQASHNPARVREKRGAKGEARRGSREPFFVPLPCRRTRASRCCSRGARGSRRPLASPAARAGDQRARARCPDHCGPLLFFPSSPLLFPPSLQTTSPSGRAGGLRRARARRAGLARRWRTPTRPRPRHASWRRTS